MLLCRRGQYDRMCMIKHTNAIDIGVCFILRSKEKYELGNLERSNYHSKLGSWTKSRKRYSVCASHHDVSSPRFVLPKPKCSIHQPPLTAVLRCSISQHQHTNIRSQSTYSTNKLVPGNVVHSRHRTLPHSDTPHLSLSLVGSFA
jgi:hypothetical protein